MVTFSRSVEAVVALDLAERVRPSPSAVRSGELQLNEMNPLVDGADKVGCTNMKSQMEAVRRDRVVKLERC